MFIFRCFSNKQLQKENNYEETNQEGNNYDVSMHDYMLKAAIESSRSSTTSLKDILNDSRICVRLSTSDTFIDRVSASKCLSEFACQTHTVSICMIDIVGFSLWCSKQSPLTIFETMTQYNSLIQDKINQYKDIEKVELVGDSVLIVGGLYSKHIHNIEEMFGFCYALLDSLSDIKQIFNSQNISIRIGVHIGDVFSGFILYPKKFQLFGNSINVSSRLESSGLPGVLHVSSIAYNELKAKTTYSLPFISGALSMHELKGVGTVESIYCFIKKHKLLIIDDVLITGKIIKKKMKNAFDITSEIYTDIDDSFDALKSCYYHCVFLDRFLGERDVLDSLIMFRSWESRYRTEPQKIVLISSIEVNDAKKYNKFNLYVDGILNKNNPNFVEEILQIVDNILRKQSIEIRIKK